MLNIYIKLLGHLESVEKCRIRVKLICWWLATVANVSHFRTRNVHCVFRLFFFHFGSRCFPGRWQLVEPWTLNVVTV